MADRQPDWPTVPDCHGWLSLDGRGQWRLKDEVITHPGLIAYLAANYAGDATGRWWVNNGPQRVHVKLEIAPWIVRLQPDGSFTTHTGRSVEPESPLLIDHAGRVFMATTAGPAALDDRDLATLLNDVHDTAGNQADDESVAARLLEDEPCTGNLLQLQWRGRPIQRISDETMATKLGFVLDSAPADTPSARP